MPKDPKDRRLSEISTYFELLILVFILQFIDHFFTRPHSLQKRTLDAVCSESSTVQVNDLCGDRFKSTFCSSSKDPKSAPVPPFRDTYLMDPSALPSDALQSRMCPGIMPLDIADDSSALQTLTLDDFGYKVSVVLHC